MSKSVQRVRRALAEAGIEPDIREVGQARSAAEAAASLGCEIDQIVKSVIFRGAGSGRTLLFLTAGGRRVSDDRAAALVGEPLEKADAAFVRAATGFAIGGVAPVGHTGALRAFLDPRLDAFATLWAAAGTPRHVAALTPATLRALTGAEAGAFTA